MVKANRVNRNGAMEAERVLRRLYNPDISLYRTGKLIFQVNAFTHSRVLDPPSNCFCFI